MPVYFDDLAVGQPLPASGEHTVTREEIVDFARQFDPQPFHLDEGAAERSAFRGLVASGWHTAALVHRLMVDSLVHDVASLGSPGVDDIRWLRPVRPGDRIRLRARVAELIPSRSKPDRGVVRFEVDVLNQRDEVVMTSRPLGMFARRPPAG